MDMYRDVLNAMSGNTEFMSEEIAFSLARLTGEKILIRIFYTDVDDAGWKALFARPDGMREEVMISSE